MNLKESNTCYGCLNTDRKMKLIDDFCTKTCFSQIISEITALHPVGLSIWLCWECSALLSRFTKFKHQVLQSIKLMQEYSKSNFPYRKLAQRLQVHKTVNIAILPNEDGSTDKKEFAQVEVLKTENSDTEQKTEEVTVKEEDSAFSNNDDDDDVALSELASNKKKRRQLKKRKKKSVDAETDVYIEVVLTEAQIEEERKALASREEYINAMFKCERCIISFPNSDDLDDHVQLKHDLNAANYKCSVCECSLATEVSYNYHARRHSRRYQCVVCGERFSSQRAVAKHHGAQHSGSNEYEDCGTDNMSKERLQSTDKNSADSAKQEVCFPCELCPKSFRWKTSLRKHLETHRIENGQKRKPYCEPCKITFTTTSNLQKHVKTSSKHQIQLKLRKLRESDAGDGAADAPPGAPPPAELVRQVSTAVNGARARHACPHCGARYQWRGNLLRHLHAHTARARGELVCQPCNRSFSSLATYQQHMRISKKHVSENDFKYMCSECGKKFANKTRLKDHVDWEHLKNYIHTCETCQKVFKSHTSLYLHRQVVHRADSARHLCHHCGKRFPNQAKLRSHITALHSGEAPYRCGSCGARFSWHSCLSRHVRRVHRKRH